MLGIVTRKYHDEAMAQKDAEIARLMKLLTDSKDALQRLQLLTSGLRADYLRARDEADAIRPDAEKHRRSALAGRRNLKQFRAADAVGVA